MDVYRYRKTSHLIQKMLYTEPPPESPGGTPEGAHDNAHLPRRRARRACPPPTLPQAIVKVMSGLRGDRGTVGGLLTDVSFSFYASLHTARRHHQQPPALPQARHFPILHLLGGGCGDCLLAGGFEGRSGGRRLGRLRRARHRARLGQVRWRFAPAAVFEVAWP